MTKIKNTAKSQKKKNDTLLLDTLAQLSTKSTQPNKNKGLPKQKLTQETLQKRAKSKAFTFSYLFDLIDLKSDLTKSYWQTYYCSTSILQEGKTLTSKYCNQRWCLTCNRIRTAKIINGYKSEIESFKDPQFCNVNNPKRKSVRFKEYNSGYE